MPNISVIILAAGKGTRMKSSLPKVMHPVAGRTLLHHALGSVLDLNPQNIVGVIGDNMLTVQQQFSDIAPTSKTIIQREQLGTGHAVAQALPLLSGDDDIVLILYGDTPFIRTQTLEKMLNSIESGYNVTVLGFTPDDPSGYGRLITDGSLLSSIVEDKEADAQQKEVRLCNSGVMAVSGKVIAELLDNVDNNNTKNEYYLTDIVAIAESKHLPCSYVECHQDEVMGINSQKERAIAEHIKQEELRSNMLDNGVIMIAPETVFLSCDTQIASGTVIHPNVVFGNDVKIAGGVEIKSFSHIEGAKIAQNSVVGPYARLRPGSDIAEDVKIGNFVEVKKSSIKTGAKISHLSYIGDSFIGENANIGAGTITCNYDGYDKYETHIGKGAFIGSNSSLVAPVNIGDGAIIGAGSTILEDVGKDDIAVNKMPQILNKNAANRFRDDKKYSIL